MTADKRTRTGRGDRHLTSPLRDHRPFRRWRDGRPRKVAGSLGYHGAMRVTLTVNDKPYTVEVDSQKPLLCALREDLGLLGTKFGCGAGLCGACSVLVDGETVRSCSVPVSLVEARSVTTIEGLNDDLSGAIRDAWLAEGVSQCGYCQPGQIVSAYALLSRWSAVSDIDIEQNMRNLCRCGTYQRIRSAVRRADEARSGDQS